MTKTIASLEAIEVIDSRGFPTVEAVAITTCGARGSAIVPSGASTGSLEAIELRDCNENRYCGKGVLGAVENLNKIIAPALIGKPIGEQYLIDQIIINLDATKNKGRLGANATLAASLAVAKAAAASYNMPLYRYLGGTRACRLPVPMMNIINGGVHADNKVDIQEFMISPIGAKNFKTAVMMGCEVFHALKILLKKAGYSTNVGDEGGFAPNLNSSHEALSFILEAIKEAGYKPNTDIAITLDAASSEFYKDQLYCLDGESLQLTSSDMVEYYTKLLDQFPIISIEDPLAEGDIDGWKLITTKLGKRVQLVGDDLFVTNPAILRRGIANGLANSILIKPNQIGTLTETMETVLIAQEAGYNAIISHRSGESEDSTIAHIAVATNAGQIKTGSLSRADRTAKYNELLRIEHQLGAAAIYI